MIRDAVSLVSFALNTVQGRLPTDHGALLSSFHYHCIGAGSVFGPKGPDYAINGMLVWGVRLGVEIEIGRKTLGNMGFRRTPSEAQIETFVDHYNHRRYHESINNLTPR